MAKLPLWPVNFWSTWSKTFGSVKTTFDCFIEWCALWLVSFLSVTSSTCIYGSCLILSPQPSRVWWGGGGPPICWPGCRIREPGEEWAVWVVRTVGCRVIILRTEVASGRMLCYCWFWQTIFQKARASNADSLSDFSWPRRNWFLPNCWWKTSLH